MIDNSTWIHDTKIYDRQFVACCKKIQNFVYNQN